MRSTGRPPSTNHEEISAVALTLFVERGFAETSVEDIAAVVGVDRRTIFRYFPSKNDLVWGDFDWVLRRLREAFDKEPAEAPLMEALRRAVVLSNSYDGEQLPELRNRMTLITTVPALQGHAMLRYAAWRGVVAHFVAERRHEAADDLEPQTIAHAALGTSMAAFKRWVENPDEDLGGCLDRAYSRLAEGFAADRDPV